MNKVLPALLTIIMLFGSTRVQADGHYLLSRCENALKTVENPSRFDNRADMAYCFGLLQGVREMNQLYQLKLKKEAYFCLNEHLSHRASAELVVNYLRKHPEKLSKNETSLATQAFRHRYPCQ